MSGWSLSRERATAHARRCRSHMLKACARLGRMVHVAFLLGALAADGALASDSVSVALNATVVSVCRFLTSASTAGSAGSDRGGRPSASATLTYACSNGTAAAFTFAVPATTNVACAACSDIPIMMGTILATSLGTGQGLGSGRDRTLTVSTPLPQAADEDAGHGAFPSRIVVTVSP